MKISKVLKKLSVTFLCFVSLILLKNNSSQAVLQSNGNDGVTYNLNDWMMNIRKMEETGGPMGLSESINSDLTTNGDSNNIDAHMQKNTEYGALAILSASSYGNPNKINDGETTTGNVTGAVMKLNKEWVAAFSESLGKESSFGFAENCNNAINRYWNLYDATYIAKKGDAITETLGWHGSTMSSWLTHPQYYGLLRSCSGSIFSYDASNHNTWAERADALWSKNWYSRAVIVQGQGI